MTDTAKAFAVWASAALGDTPPEPAPEPAQEQPEEPKAPFTALEAAAPYLPKTFAPPPAIDNRPAPLAKPGAELRSKPADVFKSFMEDVVHF